MLKLTKIICSITIAVIGVFTSFSCNDNSKLEINENKIIDPKLSFRSDLVIEDYWHGTFEKEENIILDTQSVYALPENIDYYIYLKSGEFASFILTEDSVFLVAYSDDVTEQQISEHVYSYIISIEGENPVTIETNRLTNAFGTYGNYSYELEFNSGPINLGSPVGGGGVPWKDVWCNYICCDACEKTHDILDIGQLDFVCCFYCSLCHCC